MPMTAHQRHFQFRQYTTWYIAVAGTSIVINIQRSSCHCCRLYKTSIIYRYISEQLLLCRLLIAFWRLLNKGEFPYVQLISLFLKWISVSTSMFHFMPKIPPKNEMVSHSHKHYEAILHIDIHCIHHAIPDFPKLLLYWVSERNNVRYLGHPTLIMRDYEVVYAYNLLHE